MSDDKREEEFARIQEKRKAKADKLAEELRALGLTNHEKAQLANDLQGVINLLALLAAYKPEKRIYEQYKQELTEALNHSDLQTSTSPVLGGNGPAVSSPDVTPPTPTTVIETPEQHLAALQALDEKLSELIDDPKVPVSLKEVFRTLQVDVKKSIPVVERRIEEASVESVSSVIPTSSSSTTFRSPSPSFDVSYDFAFEEDNSREEELKRALEAQQREAQLQKARADKAEQEAAALREEPRLSTEEQRELMEAMQRQLEKASYRANELESEVTAVEAESTRLRAQVTSVGKEKANLQTQLTEEASRAEGLQAQVTAGSDRITDLESQLATVRAESEQRQEQLTAATTRADSLRSEVAGLKEQLATAEAAFQERIAVLGSQLDALQTRPDSEKAQLQEEIRKLQRELEENVTSIKSENVLLKRQFDKAVTRADAAEAEVSKLQKELDRLKKERQEASIERKTALTNKTDSAAVSRTLQEANDVMQVTLQKAKDINKRLVSLKSAGSNQKPTALVQKRDDDSTPAPTPTPGRR